MSAVAMQACPGDDTITLLVCGQLAGAQVTALQSHVVECDSCRKLVGLLETAQPEGSGNERLRTSMLGLLAPGTVVGRYQIEDALGAGGMGVVYAAHDPELDRKVALKLLYPMIEADGQDELALRLRHESTTMARLRHPNVATIHDIGSYRDQLFLVMELVQGTTLRAWVGADTPWETVIATFVEAGKGLAAAHDAGIVHCDFKPDNVLLDADGRPLITDFGLAQVVADAHARPRIHVSGNPVTALGSSSIVDVAGAHVFGTPAYMAPERFDATIAADIQGDVFAFCVALYEVLYGRRPFEAATVDELRVAITRGVAAKPPETATVPTWLHRAILRGLSADRAIRYRSIGELVDALQSPPRRRSRWLVPLAGAGVVVAAIVGWQLTRHDAARAVTCNARGELAGIWDDATRTRIAGAWTGSVNAHAWERVRHSLDRYSDAWVGAADAACTAPSPIPAVAEFKHRCLHAVELKIHAVVDRFATSEATVMSTADRTVASLPSLDDCGNDAPATPIPSDPFIHVEVAQLREQLAAADAQSIAGKFDVAAAAIDKIAAVARTVDFKPLTAEIQYSRAINLRGAAAKPEVTTAALRDAAAAAEASGDEILAVKAWTALAFQAGEVTGDFERGREYVGYAAAALERLGGNPRLETQIETTRGRLDWHAGKLDDARREYEHALALAKTDPVLHIEALSGLAVVDTAAGQLAKALDEQLHVLELRRKMYGDNHPEIARSYTTLGDVTMRLARLNESLDYYQKADDTAQRVFGPEHSMCQITAHNLGGILRDLERPADAEREFRRAVRIATVAFGADHPYTAKSEQSLGMALFDQGKFAEAVTTLRHAVAVKRKAYGDTELETIGAINDLAIALRGAGKLDEALEDTDQAIVGFAATEGPKSDDLAQAYLARCRTLIAAHRSADADVALAKAKSIFAQTEAPAARFDEVQRLADQIHPKSR